MDAALEVMGSPRQARDLKLAALQSGDRDLRIGETVGALGDGVLSVEAWDESPTNFWTSVEV